MQTLNHTSSFITCVFHLSGVIDLRHLFFFLESDESRFLSQPYKKGKKIVLPNALPGSIISATMRGPNKMVYTKGIIKRDDMKGLPNAILLDLAVTTTQNVCIRIFGSTINLTGTNNSDIAIQAVDLILKRIIHIQTCLDSVRQDKERSKKTIQFVISQIKDSDAVLRLDIRKADYCIRKQNFKYTVDMLNKMVEKGSLSEFNNINIQIIPFLVSAFCQYRYVSELNGVVDWLLNNSNNVCTLPLSATQLDKALANYDYNIGFEVDRERLQSLFHNPGNGWYATYDPARDPDVIIKVEYPENHPVLAARKIRAKSGKIVQTLRIKISGHVTHSSPDGELFNELYTQFMTGVMNNKSILQF